MLLKAPIAGADDREFVEKKFSFRHENKLYVYSTAVPDSLNPPDPNAKNVTRGVTLIGL